MFKEKEGRLTCEFCEYELSAMMEDDHKVICECDEAQEEAVKIITASNDAVLKSVSAEMEKVQQAFGKELICHCITIEDVLQTASENGVALTLEQAKQIGRKAFKHWSSEEELGAIANCIIEEYKNDEED